MKRIIILLFVFVAFTILNAQNAWINEIHYDNAGSDENEFVEVIIEDAASYSLGDFTVTLYNGNNGGFYDSQSLNNFTVGSSVDNFTIYYYAFSSIQNGAPDGLALSYQSSVIPGQFLSYEGSMTASDDVASGMTSTDIGVEESGGTEVGQSLQLQGSGNNYTSFMWSANIAETPGNLNLSQTISSGTDPTIVVLSPNGGEEWEQGSTHDILWSSANFDGNIKIELNQMGRDTREILVSSTENDGSWTWNIPENQEASEWYSIMISNANDTEPWDDSNNTFSIVEPPTTVDVATIAELRNGTQDGTLYRLTGEAILTYQQSFRGQKYIQDATAAILIDDNSITITTDYDIWDGITNLIGTLGNYGGMTQFVPASDPGAASSTGNIITPEVITISQFNANFEAYESELVTIEDANFTTTGTFAVGSVYPITDNSRAEANFRTTFYDADYIGNDIPTTDVHITGLCNSRDDGEYISSRFAADIVPATAEEMITVTAPNGGEVWLQGEARDITWSSVNFDGDIRIELLIDGADPETLVASTANTGSWTWNIDPAQAESNLYTVVISDATDNIPSDSSDDFFTISGEITATDVADIAALRAGTVGDQLYRLTGEAILTFQQDFRGQKYIQDATAAILIDDDNTIITTEYQLGDGITNLTGTLGEYGGMLQFVPSEDPGAATSTGNTITPEIITIAQFNADFEAYESELITIEDASFSSTGTFGVGTEYPVTDASRAEAMFRTTFYDADYIDSEIPQTPVHITAICNSREEGNFFTARSLADIVPATSEELFTLYTPNGGEIIYQGSEYEITWSSLNYTGNVKIELLSDGANAIELDASTEDDGSWIWSLAADQTTGETFSIRISDPVDGTPVDESNAYFTIAETVPQPNIGDIIITEIMQNPAAVNDSEGEWFEIYNTTEGNIDINGWFIKDQDNDAHLINAGGSLEVPAHDYLVLGINADTSTNGGVTIAYQYSDFTLGNSSDEVMLLWVDEGFVVDEVAYDNGETFPDPTGASMELNPDSFDYNDNDLGMNWHMAHTTFGDGDFGTPGAANAGPLPGVAYNPTPEDEATDIDINADLSWVLGVVTDNFNLYFDTVNPPVSMVLDNVTAVSTFDPGTLTGSTQYFWMVESINSNGSIQSDIWSFTTESTDSDDTTIPAITALNNNYPNPFNPNTTISYQLAESGPVRIDVFNLKGQVIKQLVNEYQEAGYYEVDWHGTDNDNNNVPSGVYFYRMKSDKDSDTKKMILLK